MAKRILGIVKEEGKADPRTKSTALQTHTVRTIEARKRDAAKSAAMITTRTGRTK
jgi:hypothetical protein